MPLKDRIQDDVKSAMKARDKERLAVLRLVTAAFKQKEVDERVELDDTAVLAILDKMVKQRRDSVDQYEKAGREDLAAQERYEIDVITGYLPKPLGEDEIAALIDQAVAEADAHSMQDMGAVMALLRPEVQGRADMKAVSTAVRARLNAE